MSVTVNNASPPPTTNKFLIGDRVQATASVNVRGTPGDTLLYTQPMDALRTVIGGSTQTSNGVIWWQIDYDSGTDGWSGEDNLVKYGEKPGHRGDSLRHSHRHRLFRGWRVQNLGWSGVPKIAAGASVTIGTNAGPYTILNGTHTITAHVDDLNRFAESNETNNQLFKPITVP